MSLRERAQAVKTQGGAAADTAGLSLSDLRRDASRYRTMEDIAAMMSDSPERARGELRAACRLAFAEKQWSALGPAQKDSLVKELLNEVFGMGPIEHMLEDESISEIMINGAKNVYYERAGKLCRSDIQFENDEQVRVLIDRILSPLGRRIDESSPTVNARLAQGHRVHAIIPPLAPDGPHVTIRAFSNALITLDDMVESGSLEEAVRIFLIWAVLAKRSIAVSGGTGSGKTTLLNALSVHIPHDERIITIEDSLELKFKEHPHVVRLEARPPSAEGTGEVTIRELVINSLRMRPDRIIVGECRGGEALDMLTAMNTGHEGSLTTLHANTPDEAIDRLITMCRYAVDLPIDAIESQIANAFDLIVQTTRDRDGRRFLTEITEISFDSDRRRCTPHPIYQRPFAHDEGVWTGVPALMESAIRARIATREEVDSWMHMSCVA